MIPMPSWERCDHISSDTVIKINPNTKMFIIEESFPSGTKRKYKVPITIPCSISKGPFHDQFAKNISYLEFANITVPYLLAKGRESVYIPFSSRIGILCSRMSPKTDYGILFNDEIKCFLNKARNTLIKRLRIPLFVVEKWYVDEVNKTKRSKLLSHLHYEKQIDSTFNMKGKADVEEFVFNHPFTICLMGPNPKYPLEMVTMEQAIITEKKVVIC